MSNLGSFTPLFDEIARDHGIIAAAIFGRIWRYSQMDSGVCIASNGTIAKELGLTRMTVIRNLKALIDAGLVIDYTPNNKRSPHKLGVIKSYTQNDTRCNLELQSNEDATPDGCNLELHKDRCVKDTFNKDIRDGGEYYVSRFGKFKSAVAAETVGALIDEHGVVKFRQVVDWAYERGIEPDRAVRSIRSAIKNWNDKAPRNGKAQDRGGRLPEGI